MGRLGRGATGLPGWVWLAIALAMLTVGLWLAHFLLVNPPEFRFAELESTPTAIAATAASDATMPATVEPAAIETATVESTTVETDTVESASVETAAVDATSTPEALAAVTSPAPTLTSPPPPAPTITLTPIPERRLVQGAEQYRLGDYAAARSQFAEILSEQAAPGELRLQAQYQLAKTHLAEGMYGETVSLLDQMTAENSLAASTGASGAAAELLAKAEYLRADALSALGRYEEAAAAYTRFLEAFPSTIVTIQPKLGRIYMNRGDVAAGDAAYRAASQATGDVVHQVLLLEELASLHTNAGRHDYAAAAWDAILAVAQRPNYRAFVNNKAAFAYAAAGADATAIERWQAAIAEAKIVYQSEGDLYTSSVRSAAVDAAYEALVELVSRNVEFDLYERGWIDLEAEAYAPAVNAFSAYLEAVPADDARAAAALHGLAKAYAGLGDYASAKTTFERVLSQYPDCTCFGEVMLDMAGALAAQGDGAGARQAYRSFARDYPADALAPLALWRSGIGALNESANVEGAIDLLTLADLFPQSEYAPQALFWVGMGSYSNGMYVEATDAFSRLQRDYPDHRFDAVAYWLGRAQHELGDVESANATWAGLVQRAPDIYYGILAAYSMNAIGLTGGSMMTSMGAIAGPASRLNGDDGSQAYADQWMAQWLGVDAAGVSALPAAVANDADLRTGRLLLDLDARGDGLEALERVYQRTLNDPQAMYALSLEFERLGAYRLSLMAMSHVLALSPANLVEDGPIFIQRRIYPRPFESLITEQAVAHNIDPLLMFSLIRQESLFEEGAKSVAAAQGLAQIIPATGDWIAEQLGYPEYRNELVYRPVVNVRFGAYYLDWVRDYLNGNIVSALVGYNAGPGNSKRWREMAGADDVRFVEILEFYEPRIYVRAIASNLYHYERLYRGG